MRSHNGSTDTTPTPQPFLFKNIFKIDLRSFTLFSLDLILPLDDAVAASRWGGGEW